MQTATDICARLKAHYREVEVTRMEGVPLLNPVLQVAAYGFEPYAEYHLGVLLTPWFMNLMMVPQDPAQYAENAPAVGDKIAISLPAGQVEFIIGFEDALGHTLSCSLFSPVFEFPDQATALETAQAALAEVLNDGAQTGDEDPDMTNVWAGKLPVAEEDNSAEPDKDVNRRDFLRGGKARVEAGGTA